MPAGAVRLAGTRVQQVRIDEHRYPRFHAGRNATTTNRPVNLVAVGEAASGIAENALLYASPRGETRRITIHRIRTIPHIAARIPQKWLPRVRKRAHCAPWSLDCRWLRRQPAQLSPPPSVSLPAPHTRTRTGPRLPDRSVWPPRLLAPHLLQHADIQRRQLEPR